MICGDILYLSGYYRSSVNCSFVCMLEKEHSSPHRDEFEHEGKSVIIEWQDTDNDAPGIANSRHLLLTRQIETPVSSVV